MLIEFAAVDEVLRMRRRVMVGLFVESHTGIDRMAILFLASTCQKYRCLTAGIHYMLIKRPSSK